VASADVVVATGAGWATAEVGWEAVAEAVVMAVGVDSAAEVTVTAEVMAMEEVVLGAEVRVVATAVVDSAVAGPADSAEVVVTDSVAEDSAAVAGWAAGVAARAAADWENLV
jgi:hypothetical protein